MEIGHHKLVKFHGDGDPLPGIVGTCRCGDAEQLRGCLVVCQDNAAVLQAHGSNVYGSRFIGITRVGVGNGQGCGHRVFTGLSRHGKCDGAVSKPACGLGDDRSVPVRRECTIAFRQIYVISTRIALKQVYAGGNLKLLCIRCGPGTLEDLQLRTEGIHIGAAGHVKALSLDSSAVTNAYKGKLQLTAGIDGNVGRCIVITAIPVETGIHLRRRAVLAQQHGVGRVVRAAGFEDKSLGLGELHRPRQLSVHVAGQIAAADLNG